jgi:nucleoside 2-deoxyribosyltransferase
MKVIYLAGGIMNLTTDEANNWRLESENELKNKFKILNPMRRNFRDCEFQSQNEIVQLDKNDIVNSDILLVNGTKPSWGTAMEILFAFERHKIVVVFTGDEFGKTSPWVAFHATRVTKTLQEAIDYIKLQLEG